MPRRNRCVAPGIPCHITQRGVDRRETFSTDEDRHTYVGLLRQNLADAGARMLGWCLMTNHIHLIALPEREDSLSVLLRRVGGSMGATHSTTTRGGDEPGTSGRTGFSLACWGLGICGLPWGTWSGIRCGL